MLSIVHDSISELNYYSNLEAICNRKSTGALSTNHYIQLPPFLLYTGKTTCLHVCLLFMCTYCLLSNKLSIYMYMYLPYNSPCDYSTVKCEIHHLSSSYTRKSKETAYIVYSNACWCIVFIIILMLMYLTILCYT